MKGLFSIALGWSLLAAHGLSQSVGVPDPARPAGVLVAHGPEFLAELWNTINTATNGWASDIRKTSGWPEVRKAPVEELRLKAAQGQAVAQMELGFRCLSGEAAERNPEEAIKWLTEAAGHDLAPAQLVLAEAFLRGLGVREDFATGVEWLEKAASQGFADAEFMLGLCYLTGGPGVNQAPARGVKWITRAAEQGKPIAQQCLGECYSAGNGVNPDPAAAARWYGLAAERGLPTAQDLLAGCYLMGRGVSKDPLLAVQWYRRAAEQGLGAAQAALARCYTRGTGVETNAIQAFNWWRGAATNGFPGARFHLGLCYYSGRGVERDLSEAVIRFEQEAAHAHVGALLYLGLCYWRGEGVRSDKAAGEKWWSEACLRGIAPWRYAIGDETSGDAEAVEQWWRDVATLANATLQCCLAESYHFGHGVAQDEAEAARWYRRAATGGDLVALRRVTWLLSTCPNPKVRDGVSAVEFGEKAAAATDHRDASILDVLAAAYAETDQFDHAVRVEKQALTLASREDERADYQSRLKLYQTRKPYRAEP
jgi:uncharacterized protein